MATFVVKVSLVFSWVMFVKDLMCFPGSCSTFGSRYVGSIIRFRRFGGAACCRESFNKTSDTGCNNTGNCRNVLIAVRRGVRVIRFGGFWERIGKGGEGRRNGRK